MRGKLIALTATATTVGLLSIAPSADALSGCGYQSGYSVRVNSHTSCAFARNVARSYARGYRRPRVYSPTTGRSYTMHCSGGYNSGYCSGANGAYISLAR